MPVGQYIITNNVDSLSWSSAQSKAQALGGDLASLSSDTEINIVFVALSKTPAFWSDVGDAVIGPWIGLSRNTNTNDHARGWMWNDGSGFDSSNWADVQPNGDNTIDNFAGILRNDQYFPGQNQQGWYDTANEPTAYGKNAVFSFITELSATQKDLTGTNGVDFIIGSDVPNVIDGNGGADLLQGGVGSDIYYIDNVNDFVFEAPREGLDAISTVVNYSLNNSQEIENLSARYADSGTALILSGNSLDNRITGNAGANRLDGSTGADTMIGLKGNDTYVVERAQDNVIESANQGKDTVESSITYMLKANVENLILTGSGNLNGVGNNLINVLTGNSGANLLDGKTGADTMIGGAGDDTYLVDNKSDKVAEAGGKGTDLVKASVTYTLSSNVENLTLLGSAAISGTGNVSANTLIGNGGANVLNGGLGADILKGMGGADTFVFDKPLSASNIDHISDFTSADTIQLENAIFKGLSSGKLASSAFKDVAKGDVDSNDQILYNSKTGALSYDADGNGSAKAIQFAVLDKHPAITAADFLVV